MAIATPQLADELKPEEVLEEGEEIVRRKAAKRRRNKTSKISKNGTVTKIRLIRSRHSITTPHVFMTKESH